ncbi:MAG TPA: glycoside hydrolase domain-containing protein [Planctomycetota bacterium]|nr:glycoside hydrolase domain-containing protein [Planctomycetota bacterium]
MRNDNRSFGVRTLGLVLLCLVAVSRSSAGAETVILDTRGVWRFHETWRTEVARLDAGERVRVDPYTPRQDVVYKDEDLAPGRYKIRPTQTVRGSAFPPDDWREVTFDDGDWLARMGPFLGASYRSLALLCVRGKFEVTDPAEVKDLSLSVVFQGGLVVYLNGREVARAHLGAGRIDRETVAEDYPLETFSTPDGKLISQQWYRGGGHVTSWRTPKDLYAVWLAGYKKRSRTLEVTLPAATLRKGLNVLALEIHRAPAVEAMFVTVTDAGSLDCRIRKAFWWNRAALESVRLSAAGPAGVVPHVSRPAGLQVRTHTVYHRVNPNEYADPSEPLRPMRMCAARNGVCAGQVVVSSTAAVEGLKLDVSALAGPAGAVIPASALRVRYPRHEKVIEGLHIYDTLDASCQPAQKVPGNTRPVWVTVDVPKDARAGEYAGTLTVRVDGEGPVDVPVRLKVVDWTLPDPQHFTTHVGMVQSPESVALQYNVPMWSEKHWQLMERSFELMGRVGAKTLYVPAKAWTHFGNEHTMVRWVAQPDRTHKLDFTLVERYLDVATRHLGKVPVVCVYLYDGGPSNSKPEKPGTWVTEVNCATGQLQDLKAPDWGTPESRAFWKPVLDGMREILAKRGMERSLMVGAAQQVPHVVVDDLQAAAPDAYWVAHSHLYNEEFGKGYHRDGQPVGYLAQVGGMFAVLWDPEEGRPFYGWRNPFRVVTYPRDGIGPLLRQDSEPTVHRLCAEGALLTGRQARYPAKWSARVESMAIKHKKAFPGVRGFGRLGADFWPVLKGKRGSYPICGRYPGTDWGTLDLGDVSPWLLAPGPDGAISTVRFELMRESLQEAEARVFIQDALLDDAQRAKLAEELAGRCEHLCNERTRALRYVSEYYDDGNGRYLIPPAWDAWSEELYDLAAEVAKALN